MKANMIKLAALAAVLCGSLIQQVQAHTVTVGYENGGPGIVNFWYGSYHDSFEANYNEGSFNLVGINGNPFPSTTVPFNLLTYTQPAGLVPNVTYFAASSYGPSAFTDSISWQGTSFGGLLAGDYQFSYIPIGSPTVVWAPWDNSVLSGTFSISQEIIGSPDGGSTAILLGGALIGLMGMSRRSRKA